MLFEPPPRSRRRRLLNITFSADGTQRSGKKLLSCGWFLPCAARLLSRAVACVKKHKFWKEGCCEADAGRRCSAVETLTTQIHQAE
jgi:hypothetical protein